MRKFLILTIILIIMVPTTEVVEQQPVVQEKDLNLEVLNKEILLDTYTGLVDLSWFDYGYNIGEYLYYLDDNTLIVRLGPDTLYEQAKDINGNLLTTDNFENPISVICVYNDYGNYWGSRDLNCWNENQGSYWFAIKFNGKQYGEIYKP